MRSAFFEKSRYYANRIAQNEVMKSYSIERAKMLAEDDGFEVVKVRMSRTHERVDICDYHSKVDKFGLGAGVYPKQKAPVPPFHPFCRCIIVPLASKSATDAKFNKKADREVMQKFSSYEQSLIVGSYRRKDMFMKNGDVLKSAYIGKPLYIDEVSGVKYIGYNSDMKTIFKDFGDAIKETTELRKTVTHEKFSKYNKYFNKITLATKNKSEMAIILRNGIFLKQISGDSTKVGISTMLVENSVVIHNHPSGTSFSRDDIVSGIIHKAEKLIVFHPETYIYEAYVSKINLEVFEKEYAIISEKVDKYLSYAVSKGANPKAASFERQHYILSELARRNNDFRYKRYRY